MMKLVFLANKLSIWKKKIQEIKIYSKASNEGGIEAYSVAQSWRYKIVKDVVHVLNLDVARGTEQVFWQMPLHGAEKRRTEIQFHVLVRFRLMIPIRIHYQSRLLLALTRVPCLRATLSALNIASGSRRCLRPAAAGAAAKWHAASPAFGEIRVFSEQLFSDSKIGVRVENF